jgi:DedD protein
LVDSQDVTFLKRRARRRLVGAIALVLLFVIVLPVILDQEPKPVTQTLTVQIPSQDAGRFNTRVLPPPASPPATPQRGEPPQPAKTAPEKRSESAKPDPKRAKAVARSESRAAGVKNGAKAGSREVAKAGDAGSRRADSLPNGDAYIVPLGAFANSENVKSVQEKAASAGIKSYTEKIKGAQGEQTRVRAGPFQSKESAEGAREKLKSLGLATGEVAQR